MRNNMERRPDTRNGSEPVPTREQVYRRSHSKFRRRRVRHANTGMIIFAILLIAIISASVVYMVGNRKEGDTTGNKEIQSTAPLALEEPSVDDLYKFETVDNLALRSGHLILVNYLHEYAFPAKDTCVNIYENKTDKYKVSYSNYELDPLVLSQFGEFSEDFVAKTNENSMTINSAYRTYEEQRQIYDDYIVEYGEEAARLYVANPGYSEHHTGYAVDLTMIRDDGSSLALKNYENLDWVNESLVSHGFILRYPEEKYEITKINHEPWHYRYVSVPHSYIITDMHLCLEEYIDFVKDYTYDGTVMRVGENGALTYESYKDEISDGYSIYYVAADDAGNTTEVPVPKDADSYEISGNNVDGFIVTSVYGEVDLSNGISELPAESNEGSVKK